MNKIIEDRKQKELGPVKMSLPNRLNLLSNQVTAFYGKLENHKNIELYGICYDSIFNVADPRQTWSNSTFIIFEYVHLEIKPIKENNL